MGAGSLAPLCWAAARPLPDDMDLPPFFAEILVELTRLKLPLGGLKHFSDRPRIDHKVRSEDFRSAYTDYEYVYLTVLGFGMLHIHGEEIVQKNNGKKFSQNPGVQMLERVCGMTMHADRDGANSLLRSAPGTLLAAFQLARSKRHGCRDFFTEAFQRDADPCLEGRTGRLMEYLEKNQHSCRAASAAMPPWEDVSLRPLPKGAAPRDIVGEHLRVFVGECTWCWGQRRNLSYEEAKRRRFTGAHASEFSALYNAATFESAMRARGLVADAQTVQWEVMTDKGEWGAYEIELSAQIQQAHQRGEDTVQLRIGPSAWRYEIDLKRFVQTNPKTQKERPIRPVDKVLPVEQGKLTPADFMAAVRYFVELETLPAAS